MEPASAFASLCFVFAPLPPRSNSRAKAPSVTCAIRYTGFVRRTTKGRWQTGHWGEVHMGARGGERQCFSRIRSGKEERTPYDSISWFAGRITDGR